MHIIVKNGFLDNQANVKLRAFSAVELYTEEGKLLALTVSLSGKQSPL
jgi:hypothetical protein